MSINSEYVFLKNDEYPFRLTDGADWIGMAWRRDFDSHSLESLEDNLNLFVHENAQLWLPPEWRLSYCRWKNISFISELHVTHFYAFEEISLSELASSKEVYFLGENGDGKTLLLQAIHLTFGIDAVLRHSNNGTAAVALQLANGKNGAVLQGKDGNGKLFELKNEPDYVLNHFFAYGPNRSLYSSDFYDETGFMSLYENDVKLYSPVRILEYAKNGEVMRNAETYRSPNFRWNPLR
ncbi:MAG: hypothetical protein U0176_11855 [Bacteroidia bacterium]